MSLVHADHTVYGIDFTSAPSSRKPITRANCILIGNQLTVDFFTVICCLIEVIMGTCSNIQCITNFITDPGRKHSGHIASELCLIRKHSDLIPLFIKTSQYI